VRDFWVFTPAETYSAYISISAITEIQMEIFATADPSHLFLTAGNHTLISSLTILQRDGGDLSSIRLTKPLLKISMAYGLLSMAPPRSRIAGALDDFTMDDECQLCSRWISKLVFSGLIGADTIHCWVSRRIQPLQYCSNQMCQYSGIDDSQCYTKEELSSEAIERRIRNIIKVGLDEKLELKIPMYENDNCPEVSASLFCHDYLLL
jgi:hypothetical protein